MIHRSNLGHSVMGLTVGMTAWPPPQQQDDVNEERQRHAGPPPFSQHRCSPGQVPPAWILPTFPSFHSPLVSHSRAVKGLSASCCLQEAVSNRWGQTGGGSWKSFVIARQSLVTALRMGSSNSPHRSKTDFIMFSSCPFFFFKVVCLVVCFK